MKVYTILCLTKKQVGRYPKPEVEVSTYHDKGRALFCFDDLKQEDESYENQIIQFPEAKESNNTILNHFVCVEEFTNDIIEEVYLIETEI